jgi:hypothetical protein
MGKYTRKYSRKYRKGKRTVRKSKKQKHYSRRYKNLKGGIGPAALQMLLLNAGLTQQMVNYVFNGLSGKGYGDIGPVLEANGVDRATITTIVDELDRNHGSLHASASAPYLSNMNDDDDENLTMEQIFAKLRAEHQNA